MNIAPALQWILAIVVSYLLGSIPSGYLAGRFGKKVDIRDVGSRNMGAMNVFYSVGIIAGLLVLAVDIGKGALAIYLTEQIFGIPNQPVTLMQYISGIVAVLGHSFPVWLKFRGGKGGATCIGVLARLIPWACPYYLGFFLLLLAVSKFPTFSYSIAFIAFPIVSWFYYPASQPWLLIFSIAILLIPAMRYIPRLKEMRKKGGGGWSRVFKRSNLKDRL